MSRLKTCVYSNQAAYYRWATVMRDWVAVARCAALGVGFPEICAFIMLDAKRIIRAFEIRVSPLIHQTIKDVVVRRYVRETLLGTSVQVGLAMWAYASMARVRFDPGLAALGGSFGRVYDDLVDNFDRDQLDSRLAGCSAVSPSIRGRSLSVCSSRCIGPFKSRSIGR